MTGLQLTRTWRARGKWQARLAPYLFIMPFLIMLTLFMLWPTLYSFRISVFDIEGLNSGTYVGLRNYRDVLADPRFWISIKNTLIYMAGSVFILSPLAFLLALALHSRLAYGSSFFRLVYLFPAITNPVVVVIMFSQLFQKDFGWLNQAGALIGLSPIPWVESRNWAMISIIIVGIWSWTGINTLFFLAGLEDIPTEILDAALVDGADYVRTVWYVMIPLLRPIILFVLVQAIIGSSLIVVQPLLLTQGGPGDASLTAVLYLYLSAFRYWKLGYAAAIGYILMAGEIALSYTVVRAFQARAD